MKKAIVLFLCLLFLPSVAISATTVYPEVFGTDNLTDGSINHMRFNPNPTEPTCEEAMFYWDATDHTFAVCPDIPGTIMQLGQEMWVRAVNKTGSQIDNGEVVLIQGAQGNRPKVVLANAISADLSHGTIGVATEDIANNAEGFITHIGLVRNIDTSDFEVGDVLYVSDSTSGALTNSAPAAPSHSVKVGVALSSNANTGVMFVNVDVGNEMGGMHDTTITNPQADDSLLYNGAIWVNVPHTFGEIYYHNDAGTLDFSTTTDLINVTTLSEGLSNNMTLNGTNGSITVIDADTYRAELSASMQSASAADFDFHIGVDGTDQDKCHANRRIGTGTDTGNIGMTCLLDLAAGEVVTFMVNSAANETIKFEALNWNMDRIP
jgi:hypothetical protein